MLRAADQGRRHIGPAQGVRITDIREEHRMTPEDVGERKIPPTLVLI